MKLGFMITLIVTTLLSSNAYSIGFNGVSKKLKCARNFALAVKSMERARTNFVDAQKNFAEALELLDAGENKDACNKYLDVVDDIEYASQYSDDTKKYADRSIKYCKGQDVYASEEFLKEVGDIIDDIDRIENDYERLFRDICR